MSRIPRPPTTTRATVCTAVVLTVALAACSAPGDSSSDSKASSGPIKIAVVDAQSGQLSSLGDWEYKGAKLAVDEWNKKGGIDGRKIQLKLFDDQGDPTAGTNIARKLASEKYVAMLGTAESAVTIAMAPVLQQAKIPNITSGQSDGLVALKSPYLFLNGPTSTTYDSTLAQYLIKDKGYKKIAMITNNGSFGTGEHDAFLKAAKGLGVSPSTDQVVTTDQKDFSAALTKIRSKKPQVVFIGSEEVEAGLIVKQARDLGITAPFAGAAPQGTPVFIDTAGKAAVEGTIVSSPYLSNDASDASKKFAAAYKAAYGKDAELHGAKAYDGANILLTALKTSKAATGQDLADAIRATAYKGLLGDFAYDDTGVGITKTTIGVISDGKLVAQQ
ncbi:ABC transporter substrate-binding protein [Streptomyces pseudovenezuelae]|uniref:Branched-chain amino acid transport system substrate-binding protein n=1 Tax=Streptomyces pseudovenezuelae TaxID=67350 RepID=A0ABT6LFI3_9ACTN|nr:ABC transporter substrate-binding protein [Streptomyces pseudovenezuelae]MDH6214376.1 branched-chain amino acid transport system substrate-binding protein [Streptomyces pseudovenezuelae]